MKNQWIQKRKEKIEAEEFVARTARKLAVDKENEERFWGSPQPLKPHVAEQRWDIEIRDSAPPLPCPGKLRIPTPTFDTIVNMVTQAHTSPYAPPDSGWHNITVWHREPGWIILNVGE